MTIAVDWDIKATKQTNKNIPCPLPKLNKRVLLSRTKWQTELKVILKNLQMASPELVAQFQNNLTQMFLKQGSHRLETYLNIEGFLEESLKTKSAMKSTG